MQNCGSYIQVASLVEPVSPIRHRTSSAPAGDLMGTAVHARAGRMAGMEPNPYQSPQHEGSEPRKDKPTKSFSLRRIAMLLLAVFAFLFVVAVIDWLGLQLILLTNPGE